MDIAIRIDGGYTEISPQGSITSLNAEEFGEVLNKQEIGEGMILDFKNLEYISSAGLRVVLAAKKRAGDKLFKVVNVNQSVKNIFDVTGFSEIMDVEKAPRHISAEGCPKIGSGACGEVFRLDEETIIKLYYPPHLQKRDRAGEVLGQKGLRPRGPDRHQL